MGATVAAYSHAMTRYWGIWAALTFAAFIVPELWAIAVGRPQDTLSANVWRAEDFLPGQSILNWTFIHLAVVVVLLAVVGWLVGHFGWGLWR